MDAVRHIVATHLSGAGAGWLPSAGVAGVLHSIGVPWLETVPVADAESAQAEAKRLDVPVALKAAGPTIARKSDIGGVQLNLEPDDVAGAFREMKARIGSAMEGAVLQPMAPTGVETIIGVIQDPLLGPLVMFGLGGVATELLADRAFRILPLTDADAAELVRSLRSSPPLFGYREAPPVDIDALEQILQRIGRLAGLVPEVAELDLNPVIASPRGVTVVEARIRVAPATARPSDDIRRLG